MINSLKMVVGAFFFFISPISKFRFAVLIQSLSSQLKRSLQPKQSHLANNDARLNHSYSINQLELSAQDKSRNGCQGREKLNSPIQD